MPVLVLFGLLVWGHFPLLSCRSEQSRARIHVCFPADGNLSETTADNLEDVIVKCDVNSNTWHYANTDGISDLH